ncbi:LiaF transmembrane domain-containing protein [Fulvivirga ligni]|uniref:LiaF transmembrane domain-containing protein n=1 Tax=Fulvivirga ligni TaxID=2904246 RepID=UPI001F2B7D25|nr:DUF5668 domain-containing protein [Fulvivirga ligni]UII22094.1 cell wall-active antibiotics response protein [Fulvivirga ligni]
MSERTNDSRFWLGIFLVLIGGTLLLDNLNIIPYYIPDYLVSVKTLFILVGIYLIVGRKKPEAGAVFIVIGGIMLARDFGWIYHFNMWKLFWPAIILVIGFSLISRRSIRGNYSNFNDPEKKNGIDYFDDFAIFGGREVIIDSQNFSGGKVTAVFGGSTIDLRNANLAEGTTVIDVFAMFGGSSIIVPPDWAVHVDVAAVLGGFNDKRISTLKVVPDTSRTLIIKGFVMFGGGDVKLTR